MTGPTTIRGREPIKSAYRDESLVNEYIASRFDNPFFAAVHRRQISRINQAIRRASPSSLLEVACGPARLTTELEYVGHSVALEQSPAMLAQARRRLQDAGRTHWTLIEGDAFDLPFPPHSFDVAVTTKFLRHFDTADRVRLLHGLKRVLRPGGHLVFDVVHASAYRWLLAKWGVKGSWVDDHWFEKDDFIKEMRTNGFSVEAMDAVHGVVKAQHYIFSYVSPRMPQLGGALSRSLTSFAPFDAYEWIAVCRSE